MVPKDINGSCLSMDEWKSCNIRFMDGWTCLIVIPPSCHLQIACIVVTHDY
jgi:hypothetical protein